MNYQRKRCVGSQRGCSSCKHFLLQKVREHLVYRHRWINANVLITVEAKVALENGGLQEYNKVASGLYKKLSKEEKRELHEQKSKEPVRRMLTLYKRLRGKSLSRISTISVPFGYIFDCLLYRYIMQSNKNKYISELNKAQMARLVHIQLRKQRRIHAGKQPISV